MGRGGEKSSTKCPEALERCLAHGRSCRPGFFKVLSGLSQTIRAKAACFHQTKLIFTSCKRFSPAGLWRWSHTAQSRSVSDPAPLLFQVHRLHQSLCPLNSARKCSDGRLQDFGIHFKDGRKVLHNFKNAPAPPCPTQAAVASSSALRNGTETSHVQPQQHSATHTQRRFSAVCFSPQTPSKVKVPSATSASLSL